MADRCLSYREMRRRVGRFGIHEIKGRGKGSHRMLVGVIGGVQRKFPVPCHSEADELSVAYIRAIRRRFNLTPEHGISDQKFYA